MSTLIVALILLCFVAGITLVFIQIEKQKKRRHLNRFLARFSEQGTRNNLTFSSQEILHDAAIGLDGVHRKLLVLSGEDEKSFNNYLISLNDIRSCVVKKQYGAIETTGLKNEKMEHFLEKLSLCFELKNGADPVEVIFFHYLTGNVYQMEEMEEKARHWEVILSKMLPRPLNEVA
jgi:hypothetical protein